MTIHIQEAWWSAWQKFGWAKGIWGVGINKKVVDEAIEKKEDLLVTVGKDPSIYQVSPVTVKNQAEDNNWKYRAGRVNLYVIPQTVLKKHVS